MKLTTIITATLVPFLASAMPAMRKARTEGATSSTGSFSVLALRSGSPIHFLTLQAAGERFWLGGQAATYCPTVVENCPAGNQTVFAGGYALYAEVPGGQQVYVNPQGALSFTQAHSAIIPKGSSTGPFEYEAGSPFGHYTYNGWGSTGFIACPDNAENPTSWQVFGDVRNATVPTGNLADCLGFDAAAIAYNGTFPAWQYI